MNVLQGILDYLGESELISTLLFQFTPKNKGMSYKEDYKFKFLTNLNREYLPLPKISDIKIVPAKIELHQAKRAGTHLDFRFVVGKTVYDFALVKRDHFPERGEVMRVVRRNNHSLDYFNTNSYTFPEGTYGEGKMNTIWRGDLHIIYSDPTKIEFCIPDGEFKGRYAIHNLKEGSILIRMKEPILQHKDRMAFTSNEKKVEKAYSNPNIIAEEKIDGANYILRSGDKENTLISRRLGVDGKPINKADCIPQLKYWKIPEKFRNKDIHVEVVAENGSASETAGLLNSLPSKSRSAQLDKKTLVVYIWDIESENLSYNERRALCRELSDSSPNIDRRNQNNVIDRFLFVRNRNGKLIRTIDSNEDFGVSPEEFAEKVKSEGKEGVVLKDKTKNYYEDVWVKDKKSENYNLRVIGFIEGEGKYTNSLGALVVEDQNGVISKVGTGFTDAEREWFWQYRGQIRGEMVEVECHELTSNNVLRGPRYEKLVDSDKVEEKIRIKYASLNARRKYQ